MKTFICVFEPTTEARSNGAVPLTIALNATNEKLASASAMIKLSESYPEAMDNFNTDEPIVCEDAMGSPRPAIGEFDEVFASQNEFNGTSWQPIVYKDFNKLAPMVRIAATLLYGKTQFTDAEYSQAIKFVHEGSDQPKIRNIGKGLAKISAVCTMDAEQTIEIAQAVSEFADDEITIEDATALGESYLKEEPKQEVTSATKSENDEPILKRDYATLDMEVALALIGDVDFDAIRSADIRKAKELMAAEDKAWKRLSMDLRALPSVLDIPRESIFSLVTEARVKPELFDDANARKAFIDAKLGTENPKVTSLGNGRFSVDNLGTKPANDGAPEETIKQEKQKRTTKKKDAPAKTEKEPDSIVIEVEQAPVITEQVIVESDDFEQRADILDGLLKDGCTNTKIWKSVQRTDPRFTNPIPNSSYNKTGIGSYYMFMRATETFGPIGQGWGYEILEDKMVDGNPLFESVFNDKKEQVGVRYLRDNDGKLIFELNHSVKIKFWYLTPDGMRGEFESYGATVYRDKRKSGLNSDEEVFKKSLTDAIKKALSMLGFSSDIFMGMYDNPEYVAASKLEYDIKAAVDDADEMARIKKELDDKLTNNAKAMENAVTKSELEGISNSIIREINIHIKSAKERRDQEVEKYLRGRLRRLQEIKDKRLIQLEQKEEAI
ncbi:hypothetical protein LDO51_17485 [Providencia alcalifaciens]|uniref:hypothetical protein n=1 Tax=Providencia alcalifaciens TaxID=126385 RepID=UPI001CE0DA45|nr:hypothetical protein [Providencia alcalifaciens]UBX48905.1 hypothetical protein LDO51_17485 [Providencia alcalifaciens]